MAVETLMVFPACTRTRRGMSRADLAEVERDASPPRTRPPADPGIVADGEQRRAIPASRRGSKVVPLVGVLRTYQRQWLRGDLIAGIAVAALIIPKNLGYAGIAGIPLQNGLYAAAVGAILYAVFGTCRQISMGPSSGLAAVAASAVLTAGLVDPAQVAVFVAGITVVSGLLFLILALARMSWVARFLSRAVVTGFLFGAAIDVVIGELPKLTGTEASGSNALRELWSWLTSVPQAHWLTLVGRAGGSGGGVRPAAAQTRSARRPGAGGRRSPGELGVRTRRPGCVGRG